MSVDRAVSAGRGIRQRSASSFGRVASLHVRACALEQGIVTVRRAERIRDAL